MKRFTILLLSFVLLFSACKKDDDNEGGTLRHDGPNFTGPLLESATWEAASAFYDADLDKFVGLNLTEVEYFMGALPAEATLIIYGEGTEESPGNILYQADVSNAIIEGTWNTHRLVTPIEITGDDIWLSIRLLHTTDQQSIGCDNGEAEEGGDWLYSSLDNEWRTYRYRRNESVNWNIRGIVE